MLDARMGRAREAPGRLAKARPEEEAETEADSQWGGSGWGTRPREGAFIAPLGDGLRPRENLGGARRRSQSSTAQLRVLMN